MPIRKKHTAGTGIMKRDWRLQNLITQVKFNHAKVNGVYTVKRWSNIPKELIGHEVNVHNGKSFVRIKVIKDMIGLRFGQFVHTSVWRSDKSKVISKGGKGMITSKGGKGVKGKVKGK